MVCLEHIRPDKLPAYGLIPRLFHGAHEFLAADVVVLGVPAALKELYRQSKRAGVAGVRFVASVQIEGLVACRHMVRRTNPKILFELEDTGTRGIRLGNTLFHPARDNVK